MAKYRARKTWRFGPYFRTYSASAGNGSSRAGFTSHGFRVRIPIVGPVTYNITHRRWTWDNPGPGSISSR